MVCAREHNLCLFKIAHLKTVYNTVHSWLLMFSWEQILYKWQTEAGPFLLSFLTLQTWRQREKLSKGSWKSGANLVCGNGDLGLGFKFALMPILRERLALQITLLRSKTEPP